MSDLFLPNKDLLTNYTQISGACVRYSASKDEPEVSFNPKLYSPPIYSQETDEPDFQIKVILLPVAKVIGEDMNSGMISIENFGKIRQFKTQIQGIDYLIESEELPAVVDQKILEATHLSLVTEPFSTVIDIRQWKP